MRRSPPACSRSAAWANRAMSPRPSAPSPTASSITPPARSSTSTVASACAVFIRIGLRPVHGGACFSLPIRAQLGLTYLPYHPHVQILLLVPPFLHSENSRTHSIDISGPGRLILERTEQPISPGRQSNEVISPAHI